MKDVKDPRAVVHRVSDEDSEGTVVWDRSPASVVWGADGETLYLTVEEEGRVKAKSVGALGHGNRPMENLTENGVVTGELARSLWNMHRVVLKTLLLPILSPTYGHWRVSLPLLANLTPMVHEFHD